MRFKKTILQIKKTVHIIKTLSLYRIDFYKFGFLHFLRDFFFLNEFFFKLALFSQ